MKKFTCMMLALLLCLTSVAALAESVPSKTTADLRWIEADPEKDPEDSGFYIRIVTVDETNNQERVEICTEEIAKLAAAESVEAYFGEELDLKSIVGADELNVFENVAFPLREQKLPRNEIEQKVNEMLALVKLTGFERRNVTRLSGGQQQRVAIARALVSRPRVLLLDEPLAALDLKLRKDMQQELKNIQKATGITFVFVTHDQEEALSMSDTIVVMSEGKIQQIGTPLDIYNEPQNAFVADFIGESNILNGTMVRDNVVKMYGKEFPCVDGGFAPNEPVDVVIRPEDIDIVPVEQGQLVGTVTNVTFKGMQYDIIVDFRGFKWLIQTTDHSPEGARIGVKIDPDGFHIMKKSEYSGMFGDYSSYSEEYEELADASWETDEEESGDEE